MANSSIIAAAARPRPLRTRVQALTLASSDTGHHLAVGFTLPDGSHQVMRLDVADIVLTFDPAQTRPVPVLEVVPAGAVTRADAATDARQVRAPKKSRASAA